MRAEGLEFRTVARCLIGRSLRPFTVAVLGFSCYGTSLPEPIYVYWTMFLVLTACVLLLFRLSEAIQLFVGPSD